LTVVFDTGALRKSSAE